jgi:hypothetical protein
MQTVVLDEVIFRLLDCLHRGLDDIYYSTFRKQPDLFLDLCKAASTLKRRMSLKSSSQIAFISGVPYLKSMG